MRLFKKKKKENPEIKKYNREEVLSEELKEAKSHIEFLEDGLRSEEKYLMDFIESSSERMREVKKEVEELQEYKRKYIQLISIKGLEQFINKQI